MKGYSFNEEIRQKIIGAVKKAEAGDYVALNEVILEIQKPLVDTIEKIRNLVL